jgi:hypothetical protein
VHTASKLFIAVVLSTTLTQSLQACGDKFIRIGREVRFGRYVAIYPATILLYAPARSAPSRVADLPAVLKRAGHSALVVTTPAELSAALRDGKFDLVLAGLDQAQEVANEARVAPSHPSLMPVLIKPDTEQVERAGTLSTCRINASAPHRNDALAEIDHRMELRLKEAADAAAGRR